MRAIRGAAALVAALCTACSASALPVVRSDDSAASTAAEIDDVHIHLTNYIQEGTDIRELLRLMGDKIHRSALFGIPLQQQWSYRVSGDQAPKYYLESDAHLYYYSFTDAYIATAFLSLPPAQRARLDPMITGFNPTDMYAADHIRRVLQTFPGVFEGIGEFTIHKEFVSSKIAGDVASLTDPALDRVLDFAAEVGLVVLIHNDMTFPFPKPESGLGDYEQMRALFARHPKTTIIWAHMGMGRVVRPVPGHAKLIEKILADPKLSHVYFDLSWSEVAKYLVASPDTVRVAADLIGRHPDRFLFGSDEVAPKSEEQLLSVLHQYAPLWSALSPEVRQKVLRGNYERLFDAARVEVRAWEQAHPAAP
jgi:hypothetical protein